MRLRLLLLTLSICSTFLAANDGAAEVAAGGLQPKIERRVIMANEKLFISEKEVRVEYEFINKSPREVVTEIAFPIPEYGLGQELIYHPFNQFSVQVDGKPRSFRTQTQAWVKGRNLTRLLEAAGLDIATFASIQYTPESVQFPSQIRGLPGPALAKLRAAGAVSPVDVPAWTVRKTYYWTQRFPPWKTVRIAHAYAPVWGEFYFSTLAELDAPPRDSGWVVKLEPACTDQVTRDWVAQRLEARKPGEGMKDRFHIAWVRYILTTANSWKTPIGQFELEISADPKERPCFCWDGPIETLAPGRVRVTAKDFVPKGELTVYFLKP